MKPLTIIMTSCDRWDLFTITLDSFFALNTYPYVAFHVHNDSVKPIPIEIKQRYSDKGITWHEGVKRGLSGAWDYLVDLVQTECFFNLEEDFCFRGNEKFIEQSILLLDNNIADQVWIRDITDHSHPFAYGGKVDGVPYARLLEWGDWCGFSFNPSVRIKSKWNKLFPNGIKGKDEIELSKSLKSQYKSVNLTFASMRHIGGGKRSKNFKL